MKQKNHKYISAAIISSLVFLLLATSAVWIGSYYYKSYSEIATNQVIAQRGTVAALSASAMKLKLDQLVALAHLFASQPDIQNAVGKEEWTNAIKIIKDREATDPTFYDYYVDKIIILDAKGTIMAAFPAILTDRIGKIDENFGEWSQHIINAGADAYVSNVEMRNSTPQIHVVKIVVPIKYGNVLAGILRLDIPTNNFSDFGKDVDIGRDGFAYFIDRIGQIVTHPKFSSNGPIIDYNSVPAVQAVLENDRGFDVAYNPIENQTRIAAYQKVPAYGWAVIAQEPVAEAFSSRDAILNSIVWLIALACIASFDIAYWIFMNI